MRDPTRGATPLRQRVAFRGRGWQNLLPLGVFGGCEVGSFPDLPLAATSCQHQVRHLLRHLLRHRLKANTYGDDRQKGFELGISTDIEVISGHSSPSKVVAIEGTDDEAIKKAFA